MPILHIKIKPVYPCVYREHYCSKVINFKHFGLSLCIQGTYVKQTKPNNAIRFIPVYTGNIFLWSVFCPPHTVYPCVYREHIFFRPVGNDPHGLSLCIQGTWK